MVKAISDEAATRQADALKVQIKEHLKKERITQAALAERLGCTRANVSKLLRRGGNTTISSLVRLAAAAGLEIVTVARGEKPKKKAPRQQTPSRTNISKAGASQLENDKVLLAALEALGHSGPEAREYLRRVGNKANPRPRGRRRVPLSNYQAHVEYMADMIVQAEVSGNKPNEREASRQAAEWAEQEDELNTYSSETIRTRFRMNSEAHLEAARERRRTLDAEQIGKRRDKAAGRSRSGTVASRARQSGAGIAARTSSRTSDAARTSSLMDKHLTVMVDRFGLSERAIELLSRPDVFEEACRIAEAQAAALAPIKAHTEVLKEASLQKDLFEQIRAHQIADQATGVMGDGTVLGSVPQLPENPADHVREDLAVQTALGSIPQLPENPGAKPVGQDIIERQLAASRAERTSTTDARDLIDWATRSSKPIETGITSVLGTSVHERMNKTFESFKVKSDPFE